MRKKLKMRSGGKVAKYAEGGRVGGQRPQEDRARMAAEAAAGFDAEEARIMERRAARARPAQDNPWARGESILTNRPVGAAPRAMATPARMANATDMAADGPAAGSMANSRPLPTPPRPPRSRVASTMTRSRSREMSADELNDREMTRILNERSLEAARAGRNMYRKGGMVSKKGNK